MNSETNLHPLGERLDERLTADENEANDSPRRESVPAAERHALLGDDVLGTYRGRWDDVQAAFVDNPRGAVTDADRLVQDVMRGVTDLFARERGRLEKQWDDSDNPSTEDLRLALQRYRSFFERLLAT